jgi:hypothetical protein
LPFTEELSGPVLELVDPGWGWRSSVTPDCASCNNCCSFARDREVRSAAVLHSRSALKLSKSVLGCRAPAVTGWAPVWRSPALHLRSHLLLSRDFIVMRESLDLFLGAHKGPLPVRFPSFSFFPLTTTTTTTTWVILRSLRSESGLSNRTFRWPLPPPPSCSSTVSVAPWLA